MTASRISRSDRTRLRVPDARLGQGTPMTATRLDLTQQHVPDGSELDPPRSSKERP